MILVWNARRSAGFVQIKGIGAELSHDKSRRLSRRAASGPFSNRIRRVGGKDEADGRMPGPSPRISGDMPNSETRLANCLRVAVSRDLTSAEFIRQLGVRTLIRVAARGREWPRGRCGRRRTALAHMRARRARRVAGTEGTAQKPFD